MRKTPWIQQAWPSDPRVAKLRVKMAGVSRFGWLKLDQCPRWHDGQAWVHVLWDEDVNEDGGFTSAAEIDGLVVVGEYQSYPFELRMLRA